MSFLSVSPYHRLNPLGVPKGKDKYVYGVVGDSIKSLL